MRMVLVARSALIVSLVLCLAAAGPIGGWLSAVCVAVQHDHCPSGESHDPPSCPHGGEQAHSFVPLPEDSGCPESEDVPVGCPEDHHHHSLSCHGSPVGLLGPIEDLLDPPDQDCTYLLGSLPASSSLTVSPPHRPPIG